EPELYSNILASTLRDLATLLVKQESFQEAERVFLEVIRLHEDLENLDDLALTTNLLRSLHEKMGKDSLISAEFLQEINLWRKLHEKGKEKAIPILAETCYNYGNFLGKRGKREEAEEFLLESIKLLTNLEQKSGSQESLLIHCILHLGIIHREMERMEDARDTFKNALYALERAQALNHEKMALFTATIHLQLYMTCKELLRFTEAARHCTIALPILRELNANGKYTDIICRVEAFLREAKVEYEPF
ncbi:tetratricopeptide repeat protein, partial [Candidatus Bathyarchaeota archaeon]|nr:tetratricopeptide repeat protein [Candidatus Bathyarchaeota archaeon]